MRGKATETAEDAEEMLSEESFKAAALAQRGALAGGGWHSSEAALEQVRDASSYGPTSRIAPRITETRPDLQRITSFGSRVNVFNVTRAELLQSFDLPKTVCLEFSPKNNVLATWQAYATAKDGTAGVPNLQLHDLRTGKCLKSFVQKKMQNW
ncbi:hypothetical protein EK904_013909 [Melospiza melodia maxima]|nr:hypothetical protein EK904_013909 [Melospiza melodia maxima]